MLAIVESCGKQYQLQEGRYVDFEYLGVDEKAKVEFDKVVMIVAGENSIVGQPYVDGAKIAGTVLLNSKNQKVLVYKQRCKKGYRKKQGHRQMFSRVMIDSIAFPGKENLPVTLFFSVAFFASLFVNQNFLVFGIKKHRAGNFCTFNIWLTND